MVSTRTDAKGKEVWVVTLRLKNRKTGEPERYRRDARIQTKAGAVAEERGVVAFWTEHGTVMPLVKPEPIKKPEPVAAVVEKTWAEAVERFELVVCPTLKPSTVKGYKQLLAGAGFTSWQKLALASITEGVVAEWDGMISCKDTGESHRRNHHVVLRSVLRCAVAAGWLADLPKLPKLPKVGRVEVQAVNPEDVHALLYESDEGVGDYFTSHRKAARRAFALMALAGLRSSEVRGLRWRDVDARRGVLTVREAAWDGGETIDKPKSGHEREIPITPALAAFLGDEGEPGDFVAVKPVRAHDETPVWSDGGIYGALQRACDRIGIEGQRAHALRHAFVTGLFDAGIGAHVVQALAGHGSLDVTQRYAHVNFEKKQEAMAKLGARLASMANVVRLPKRKPTQRAKRATG